VVGSAAADGGGAARASSAGTAQAGVGPGASSSTAPTGNAGQTGASVAGAAAATMGAAPSGGVDRSTGDGFYRLERLDRGVVAIAAKAGVFVSWRMFGYEYAPTQPERVYYELYRDGAKIADVKDSTNYLDAAGTASAQYSVRAVIDGVSSPNSADAAVWKNQYLRIPLEKPAGDYSANDASVADLDGDGVYEVILKWDPSNAKDNSQSGITGSVFLDALKLDGTRLWRIDLGPNIRAGAHYTQFIVYDFDNDGSAELAVKTAPGTKAGDGMFLALGPAAADDDSAVFRNADGYVLSGP
jgi:hypothetical protein